MQKTRTRILLTVLLFSAAIPSMVQTGKIMAFCCRWKPFETMVRTCLKESLKKDVNDLGRALLAKVDTQEPQELANGFLVFLTSLNDKEKEKVHKAFDLLEIPKSLAKDILILGMKHADYSRQNFSLGETWVCGGFENMLPTSGCFVPYLITLDTRFLARASDSVIEFTIIHEVGHVKASFENIWQSNEELNELIADCYALNLFIRWKNKDQLKNLGRASFFVPDRPETNLSSEELVYYGDELFGIRQKGDKFDVLVYAQKIMTDRKKDGYKERVEREAKKLGFTVFNPPGSSAMGNGSDKSGPVCA